MKNGLFILQNNLVINVVVADPTGQWQPPEGCTTMPIPENCPAGIGWTLVDDEWIAPPPPPVEVEESI